METQFFHNFSLPEMVSFLQVVTGARQSGTNNTIFTLLGKQYVTHDGKNWQSSQKN